MVLACLLVIASFPCSASYHRAPSDRSCRMYDGGWDICLSFCQHERLLGEARPVADERHGRETTVQIDAQDGARCSGLSY